MLIKIIKFFFKARNFDLYFNNPENELFFLNLLACRYETAKIFWTEGRVRYKIYLSNQILPNFELLINRIK